VSLNSRRKVRIQDLYSVSRVIEEKKIQGNLAHKKLPPWDPTVGLCLAPYGDPRGARSFL
jgi:hypothetical protein